MSKRQTASQYKGVTRHRWGKKWQATITYNGKREYIGIFEKEEDAAKAYQKRYNEIKHLITSRVNNTSHYVDERELRYEMLISLAMGQLTRKMTEMIVLIAKRTQLKFRYKDDNHRYDCYMYAVENMLTRWYNYDADKYELVLPFVTECCKRAYAFHWTNHIAKHANTISIEGTFESGKLNI